ncbi:ATP-binding protein [Pseudoalteromonas sp. MMG013]|uniref:ATP-binding protein n=1 Tax=Pseudoalteromonas sp. MMG013 TaxID=2822687 RepID=UPI001B37A097|nr:ATP-binding protein [Pseudoalteromonas sp. MMG013]MBQ4860339.1 ATP-binding protein [Pseudoalteromonas sp. MMG013]
MAVAKKPTLKRQDPSLPNNNMLIVGASGSGKSAFLRKTIDFAQKRIVAWDPEEDYALPRVTSIEAFLKLARKSGYGPIRVAVTVAPTEENFERWAGIVFELSHAAAPMAILADEIADVTRVSKASYYWGQLCRKVRKYGGTLCAITQRPQEADKTIMNQVEYTWCGALKTQASAKYMAGEMGVSVDELQSIKNIHRKQIQFWIRKGTEAAKMETIKF